MDNNKKISKKIMIIIIVSILIFALGFLIGFGVFYVQPELSQPLSCDEFYSNWMSYLDDDALITDIVIPGSHDAGSNNMIAQAMTQGHNYDDQLKGGVRYFDTRVTKKNNELVIFHGPIKGQKFDNVLDDIKGFIDKNPTEFIIFKFKIDEEVQEETKSKLIEKLGDDKLLTKSKFPDLNKVTMKDLRENGINYMFVWNFEEESNKTDYLYFIDDYLTDQYVEKIHKGSDEGLIDYFDTYYQGYEEEKIFILQAQKTCSIPIKKISNGEIKFKPKVNKYIKNISKNPEILAKTNVIMRDFIVSDMENVKLILGINLSKDTIKDENREYFSKFISL